MLLLTDTAYPRILVKFGGNDSVRPELEINAEEFIAVKGFKAKGKRITTYTLGEIEELEPIRQPEPEPEGESEITEQPDDQESPDMTSAADSPDSPDGSDNGSEPRVVDGNLFDF